MRDGDEMEQRILNEIDQVHEQLLLSRTHVLEAMIISNQKECQYIEDCLVHGKEPVGMYLEGEGIKNRLTRIKALIKRTNNVWKTLFKHFTDVMGGFFGKFRKSGAKKSMSAIADETLRKKLDPGKKLAESQARVKIPYTGKESQTEVELINSAFLINNFISDTEFEVDLMGINYLKNDKGKMQAIDDRGEGVKGLASVLLYSNAMLYFTKHTDDLDKLMELIVTGFKIVNDPNGTEDDRKKYRKEVASLSGKCNSKLNAIKEKTSTRLSMKELTSFQSKVNKLEEDLDFIQNGNTDLSEVDNDTIIALNSLVNIVTNIQFGLTSLSNAMQKVHLIDLKYMNAIDDRDILSKFVYDCIINGIPPKYIAYNTWLIAQESIRGDASVYKPTCGQTRCIFFPNKKEILKIAINGNGVTSNKNELRFSQFLKNSKEEDMIKISALVNDSYSEDAIISMERIIDSVGKHPDLGVLNEIKGKFIDFTKRHAELRLVVTDFNDGNVMWSSDRDCWVCIDYGLGKRNTQKKTTDTKKEEGVTEDA